MELILRISGPGITTITSTGGGRGGIGANTDCPTTGGSGGGGHQYGQNIPNAGCIPGASGNVHIYSLLVKEVMEVMEY
jgi:hypothetical protein